MKTFALIKSDIDMGYEFQIETIDKSDFRTAEIGFSHKLQKYYILFNGVMIHTCKGFKSLITRLNKIDQKFPLENYSGYN